VRFLEVLSKVERMADHATNIAECVIFLIEARMVRHLSVDEILSQTGEVHNEADNDTYSDDGL
jgi:phosphate uptake regulator